MLFRSDFVNYTRVEGTGDYVQQSAAVLTLGTSNPLFTGRAIVANGVMEANATGALSAAGLVDVKTGATFRLTGSDALGASSIVVTHDVQESLKIVDYVYFVSEGRIVAEGTPDDIRRSPAPYVHQFVWGEADGPVAFHYPARPFGDQLMERVAANG